MYPLPKTHPSFKTPFSETFSFWLPCRRFSQQGPTLFCDHFFWNLSLLVSLQTIPSLRNTAFAGFSFFKNCLKRDVPLYHIKKQQQGQHQQQNHWGYSKRQLVPSPYVQTLINELGRVEYSSCLVGDISHENVQIKFIHSLPWPWQKVRPLRYTIQQDTVRLLFMTDMCVK